MRAPLALLVVFPVVAAAQAPRDTTARIVGTTTSAFNGRPVSGVMIAVPAARQFVVTDSTGQFELGGLGAGSQKLRISYRDRVSETHTVKLAAGRTKRLSIVLDVDSDAVELAPVVVEATSLRAQRGLVGFYDRRRIGFGRYYTREDIGRLRPTTISSLLALAGITVRCAAATCTPVQFMGSRLCRMAVYWNGLPVPGIDISVFQVDEIDALEVYRRAVEIPLDFPFAGATGCGAIVLWTGIA
jgi:hypothetical protein